MSVSRKSADKKRAGQVQRRPKSSPQFEMGELDLDQALAETLRYVSEALTSTLDLEQVLSRILDELAHLVPYDSATVMLLEEGILHLYAERGFHRPHRGPRSERVTFIPEQMAFAEELLTGKRPLIVADVKTVPNWVWIPGSDHIRSWLGVPLLVHGQAIGLFSIDKAQPDFFTKRHAALASALAPHAAIAIENARLFHDVQTMGEQLRRLTLHVIDVQEAERRQIGSELHDHAGQALLALRAELQILDGQIPDSASEAHTQLARIDAIVRETARDLRLLSHELRTHLLDELGLPSALQQQAREFTERFGVHAEFVSQGDDSVRRPRALELAAFRIAQEALTNAAQHSHAEHVRLVLAALPGRLRLCIEDDGDGFDVEQVLRQGAVGLVGMRERAAALNGSLTVHSHATEGTRIVVEFPDET